MLYRRIVICCLSSMFITGISIAADEAPKPPTITNERPTVVPPVKNQIRAAKPTAKPAEKKAEKKLAASDLSADKIVEKNIAARGGAKAWHAINAISFSGKMDAGQPVKKVEIEDPHAPKRPLTKGERIQKALEAEKQKKDGGTQVQVPFTKDLARPSKSRLEIEFQGQKAVQVYDGQQGWKLRPFMNKKVAEAYTEDELAMAKTESELDGLLMDAAKKGYKISVLGMETVAGKKSYKLQVTLSPDVVRYVWVDAKSFLEVQIGEMREMGGKERLVATVLSDYKSVGPVKIPHHMETHVEGTKFSKPNKIVIEKVTLNPKFADNRFAKPE